MLVGVRIRVLAVELRDLTKGRSGEGGVSCGVE